MRRRQFDFHANNVNKTRMVDLTRKFDVLVIGGGNAALCAAISARRAGASVLVLEGAPKFYRGGNTRHTRNMRCAHDAATDILTGPYTEQEFWDDLLRVTGGQTDEELAKFMIRESKDILDWIVEQGVRWQPSLGGTLSLGRTNSFFLGGGRAMLNALYLTAEKLGVEILYDAEVTDLDIEDGMFLSATLKQPIDGVSEIRASTLVAAAGGFEANIEWLKQYWGEAADNFLIRGTPYNRGSILKMLLAKGVQDSRRSHAMPCGGDRRPRAEIRRRHHHAARLGRVRHRRQQARPALLRRGRGHLAEALRDLGPAGGRAARPDRLHHLRCQRAPQLHADAVSADRGRHDRRARRQARPRSGRAGKDRRRIQRRGAARHLRPHHPRRLPHRRPDAAEDALGAQDRDARPIYAYPVRPGITFTYLGTRVNKQSRMLMKDGKPSANMFAAGEIMAGNVLGKGYAAGIGMTIGSVFGRVAGREAARNAKN